MSAMVQYKQMVVQGVPENIRHIYVASMFNGATGRHVGNLVSWVSVNSNSSQPTEIL